MEARPSLGISVSVALLALDTRAERMALESSAAQPVVAATTRPSAFITTPDTVFVGDIPVVIDNTYVEVTL